MAGEISRAIEVTHRIETIEHWLSRVKAGDTPAHLIWPAFVVGQNGELVTFDERVELLRELGIEVDISQEPDVYDFAEGL